MSRASRADLSRRLKRELDILQGGKPGQQRIALENHAAVETGGHDRLAIDGDPAFVVALQPGGNRQQRGLAAARGADKRDKFILAYGEVDALKRDSYAPFAAEGFAEPRDDKFVSGHRDTGTACARHTS